MERRKISAKEAVADIRSGVDDAALMKKYGLSPNGLQSLFDKVVNTGFIDLGEMQNRLHGFPGYCCHTRGRSFRAERSGQCSTD